MRWLDLGRVACARQWTSRIAISGRASREKRASSASTRASLLGARCRETFRDRRDDLSVGFLGAQSRRLSEGRSAVHDRDFDQRGPATRIARIGRDSLWSPAGGGVASRLVEVG
jgi:hypothetical protein